MHTPLTWSYAYVTYIDGHSARGGQSGYLPGLRALAASLVDSGTAWPLLVAHTVTRQVNVELQQLASRCRLNIQLAPVADLPNVRWRPGHMPHFRRTMSKLRIWQLPAERLVYLDTDLVVVRNIDELFDAEAALPFRAVSDLGAGCGNERCRVRFALGNLFNSGVMVVTPSNATFARMERELPGLNVWRDDGSDQSFLNGFFRCEFHGSARLEPWFNMQAVEEQQDPAQRFNRSFASVRVLHFASNLKPWVSRGGDRVEGIQQAAAWWIAEQMPRSFRAFARANASSYSACGKN